MPASSAALREVGSLNASNLLALPVQNGWWARLRSTRHAPIPTCPRVVEGRWCKGSCDARSNPAAAEATGLLMPVD